MANPWSSMSRRAKLITTGLTMFFGLVFASSQALPVLEPATPVLHYHMRAYVPAQITALEIKWNLAQAENTKALYGLQIDNAVRDCEAAAEAVINKSAEREKARDSVDRERIEFQIAQKRQLYGDLDSKLKGWRGGQGCPYSTGR